ncbi:MAG: 16S rRNA (cytosine(1402)-N(4))-methyltransferase RsmH [Bacteroidia bacterium]|jgi:16S rRNA (cytosine1402-N4)-methyltransferase|nr:16S rRNA (cytosine(1402)-N(4))-methyltransferase RsmH [Bacteroidia bacterium]GIV22592.1 MAG: ribosomal RNA small subunit methyltransferase H [Bacteroidia bacterium]
MTVAQVYHIPVLLRESVEALVTDPSGIYVDATFGGGGHSRAILASLTASGRLLAIDQDPEVPAQAIQDSRFTFLRGNFRDLPYLLRQYGIEKLTGILADLGVSSHQIDTPERGFSFKREALLDLRMNPQEGLPARVWIAQQEEETLADILRMYGDLPKSRRLARAILQATHPAFTTTELADCARRVYGREADKYLPQLFQAIRIAVNEELSALESFLTAAESLLMPKGHLVVLTYHSGEVRQVKKRYQHPAHQDPITGQKTYNWRLVRRCLPAPVEVQQNPRSRSAQLWVLEKL